METRDYLLRQIEAFGKAVAVILGQVEEGDEERAYEGVVAGLRALIGASPDALSRLSADALVPMLSDHQTFVRSRAIGVVEYMALAARLAADRAVAHARMRGVVRVLALLSEDGESEYSTKPIAEFSRKIYLNQLESGTLRRLLAHFERTGRFDRAEDVLHAWLDVDQAAAFDAGMPFYQRMWGRPEAQCVAGGLAPSEVLEGISELQRRTGRK